MGTVPVVGGACKGNERQSEDSGRLGREPNRDLACGLFSSSGVGRKRWCSAADQRFEQSVEGTSLPSCPSRYVPTGVLRCYGCPTIRMRLTQRVCRGYTEVVQGAACSLG